MHWQRNESPFYGSNNHARISVKLYEFEGKALFDRAGIKIPPGKVVKSPDEAAGLTKQFGAVMAKAQVLQGTTRQGTRHHPLRRRNANWPTPSARSSAESSSDETIEKVLVETEARRGPRGLRRRDLRASLAGRDSLGRRRRRRRTGLPRVARGRAGRAGQHPSRLAARASGRSGPARRSRRRRGRRSR